MSKPEPELRRRPRKWGDSTTVRGVRIPDGLWEQLEALAVDEATTRNELIVTILRRSVFQRLKE